jgi:hypothetical protein
MLRQPLSKIKLGRPAREFLQMVSQLGEIGGIAPGFVIGQSKLFQRSHQGLRHKNPTITAKPTRRIRQGMTVSAQRFDGRRSSHENNLVSARAARTQTGFQVSLYPFHCHQGQIVALGRASRKTSNTLEDPIVDLNDRTGLQRLDNIRQARARILFILLIRSFC